MPVPNSPHLYRRVINVEPPPEREEDFESPGMTKPPVPRFTSKFEAGRFTSGVEAFLSESEEADRPRQTNFRKTSLTSGLAGAGGYHRGRERTRQSAVQRLVERKLAQKEKEKEKERECWASQHKHPSTVRSDYYYRDRDRSGTRSENGFILGAGRCSSPSKENVDPDDCSSWSLGGQRPRRTARSCSGGRYRGADSADEATAKTYITIGPGKPTRIREHSPSKSAKLSSDESVTSARERSALSRNSSPFKAFDLNRSTSPSPQRKTRDNKFNANELNCRSSEKKKELFRDTSPLKSTNIFKNFRASKSDLLSDLDNEEKKAPRPFTTEKTFLINQSNKSKQNPKERRLSIEILNSCHRINEKNRASPESDSSQISSSTLSSFSSPLSSSSESFHSSSDKDKPANVRLSQRRISLEQRLNARTRINSPERCPTVTVTRKISETQTSPNGTTTTTSSTSSFIYRKSSTCANLFSSKQPSEPSSSGLKQSHLSQTRPVPASRKISLQVSGRRPEPAPRRRSLSSLIEPSNSQRLADEKKEEGNQFYKQKQYREALSKYSEAIDLCPQCVPFYGNRSAVYLMLGQPRQALEDAKTATSLDPEFAKGWTRIARCCVMLGDTVTARQALTKLGSLGEDTSTEQRNVDMIERMVTDSSQAYAAGDYRKSLWCLDKALELANYSTTIKTSRAECLAFLGRYAEASETANSVLQIDNMNADAIYVRGLCLYYEDNVDRAFSHFTQVLRFAPDHARAKEIYKKAKSLKSKKEEGNTAFKAGNLEEAYKLYSEALLIDPCNRSTNAKLHFNRATVSAKQKKSDECIKDCDRALELDPSYTKAMLRRAKCYMESEQYEEAVRDYEKVLKSDKGNMEYRQLLQEAKLELKKSKRKDFYKILGVEKTANDDEIKKAYRKRAMVHHPDRHSSASDEEKKDHETKFKEVGEAYAILSDEKKRRMYDSGQDLEDGGCGGGFHDVDPNSIFQAFFGGGMGGMGGHPGMGGHSFQFAQGGHGGGGHGQSFSFQFG